MIKLVESRNWSKTTGRTASLNAAMASSMGLNDKLAKQVEKIAVGVKTESVGCKRKANVVHEKAPVPPQKAEESDSLPASNSEAELDSDSSSDSTLESEDEDDIGGSEAALKALMKAQPGKSAATRTRLPAVHMNPIVQEVDALPRKDRILITPDILLALKDSVHGDVDGRQRFEVISSLKFVVKWASDPTEQVQCVSSYRAYAEAVTAYVDDLPVASEQTAEIDRLASELDSKVQCFSEGTNATSSTATRASNATEPHVALRKRVLQIDKMPLSKHRQQMLGLLISFKAEASIPWTYSRSNRLKRTATTVARWMRDAPREPELLCLDALLVAASLPWDRNHLYSKFLKGIEQPDTCSTVTEIEGMLDPFRVILNHVTLGWVSREDPTVQKIPESRHRRIGLHKVSRSGKKAKQKASKVKVKMPASQPKSKKKKKKKKRKSIGHSPMSDNDDALYERIVRMIPVDALQNSYNNVIQDGVSSVNDAVDGAVAALAHLKEVRDAVDKLGQDRPQRNKNLLNTMNRTMALQLELELALQKIWLHPKGSTGDCGLGREIRENEFAGGACCHFREKCGVVAYEGQYRSEKLDGCISEIFKVNGSVRSPNGEHKGKDSIERPLPSISSKEQQHAAIYTTLIKDGKQMPIRSRLKIIPRILLLLKDAMVTDEAGALKTAISDSIEELLKWMVEGCKMWQDLGSYQVFAVILSSYAAQHPEMGKLKSISNENNKQRASGKLSSPKLELTKGNYLEKLQMMTQSSVGARRLQLPVVLVKLTDIALMSGSHEQLSILKYVLLWAKLSAGSGDDLSAYDEFCKDMAVIISKSPGDGRKAGLERLNTSLLALLKEQKTNSKESSTDMSLSYELMVFRANAMAPSDRGIQIPQVFSSLKKEMSRGAAATNVQEILKALRTVKQWANYLPEESNLRQLYGDLTEQIELYNRGVSVFHAKVSLTSEIQNFRTIAGIAISETIDGVLAKVKQLSEASGDQRLLQLDECILMFGKVLPRTGERRWPGAVVKSYELLLKYLEPCPPGFRNQRITALNKWMHPRRRR
ncbi:hypothetical protein P3T76_008418 [Phytophthora citrophthora]|uniref:Uncharacterized protein n=1 Tax=Phytophthora citrophthora TaxID=4793 RepID=A0AAD9GKC1_9STRA|nr:hypothetical protein P3T76_008418 [Phytophthora citrophthora]